MGKAPIYLLIHLMPAGSGEKEGTFGGLLSVKGHQQEHSFSQDVLHIEEYTHNQYTRKAKDNFLDARHGLFTGSHSQK